MFNRALVASLLLLATSLTAAAETIKIDGRGPGLTFDGLGGLSAGAGTRLLPDYPEPQRSQLLDLLFKPNFGASLHCLKVEIGGDINSTEGTEPSFARTREEFDRPRPECFDRGYEWWLMREAKRRNPKILLGVLQWGAPDWIGEREFHDAGDPNLLTWQQRMPRNCRKFFTQDNADFIARFIEAAKTHHGLDIDFCGVWNESGYDVAWIKLLRKTLDRRGLARIGIVADDGSDWRIAEDVVRDPELKKAVYAVGNHYPNCQSTATAKRCGKTLWASEDNADWLSLYGWPGWPGAAAQAKQYNRNYIDGRMTSTIVCYLIASYYDALSFPNCAAIRANEPWSGHYDVWPLLWAMAHTTQFAQPGWRYLDSGCGLLKQGGSFVTLRSPDAGGDYSVVIETGDAKAPQTLDVRAARRAGRRAAARLAEQRGKPIPAARRHFPGRGRVYRRLAAAEHLFAHDDDGAEEGDQRDRDSSAGRVSPALRRGFPRLCAGQDAAIFHRSRRHVRGCPAARRRQLPPPDHRPAGDRLGRHRGRRSRTRSSARASGSTTRCRATACVERAGYAAIFGRIRNSLECPSLPPHGYWLLAHTDGHWELKRYCTTLRSGRAALTPIAGTSWRCGSPARSIAASIDGVEVTAYDEDQTWFAGGMAGLGTGWNNAMFADFRVREIPGPPPPLNLASGRPAFASGHGGSLCLTQAYFAVNGDLLTGWTPPGGHEKGGVAGSRSRRAGPLQPRQHQAVGEGHCDVSDSVFGRRPMARRLPRRGQRRILHRRVRLRPRGQDAAAHRIQTEPRAGDGRGTGGLRRRAVSRIFHGDRGRDVGNVSPVPCRTLAWACRRRHLPGNSGAPTQHTCRRKRRTWRPGPGTARTRTIRRHQSNSTPSDAPSKPTTPLWLQPPSCRGANARPVMQQYW